MMISCLFDANHKAKVFWKMDLRLYYAQTFILPAFAG
jgi:hypothetical protein